MGAWISGNRNQANLSQGPSENNSQGPIGRRGEDSPGNGLGLAGANLGLLLNPIADRNGSRVVVANEAPNLVGGVISAET